MTTTSIGDMTQRNMALLLQMPATIFLGKLPKYRPKYNGQTSKAGNHQPTFVAFSAVIGGKRGRGEERRGGGGTRTERAISGGKRYTTQSCTAYDKVGR